MRVIADGSSCEVVFTLRRRPEMSDEEFLGFVKVYPALRAQADGLYLPELEPEAPAIGFDPTVGYE